MPTDLRHDQAYLQRLIANAIRLHLPNSPEAATMLADVRDYLMYLTLDGLEDPELAKILVDRFSALQTWLDQEYINKAFCLVHPAKTRFYTGFLFSLEQLLSLRHQIAKLPQEKISRQDFNRSWKQTALKLGLQQ
jgi:hypothetical protein